MSEVSARDKYSCPACGAEATWNPGKQALVCAFCGTVSPAKLETDGSIIQERDLATALREAPDSARGLQIARITVKCQSCQAVSSFDPKVVAQRCEFCGSSALVPYEEIQESIRPESLLPFKLPETEVRDRIRAWYGSRWFAPGKLSSKAMTDTVKGIYLPYWTFDAKVHADWTAEAGHYYYVTETSRDSQGRSVSRQVRKIRWVPASGALDHFFDDELVFGSTGIQRKLISAIEPFPTSELVPYDPGYLSGWIVERYQIGLPSAAHTSRQEMEAQIRAMCASSVPGDTHRNLQVNAKFFNRTFKHILLPIWLLTYNWNRKTYRVVVNGYTGKIAGDRPYSGWKIFCLVVSVLLSALILFSLLRQ